jgi:hypothetical protein
MTPCSCCGYNTIRKKGDYEICPICHWEDDYVQDADPWLENGSKTSLAAAQQNYQSIGVSEPRFEDKCRAVSTGDVRDEQWRELKDIDKQFIESTYRLEMSKREGSPLPYEYWLRNKL